MVPVTRLGLFCTRSTAMRLRFWALSNSVSSAAAWRRKALPACELLNETDCSERYGAGGALLAGTASDRRAE